MNKKRETIEDGFFPEWLLWRGSRITRLQHLFCPCSCRAVNRCLVVG
ncbi:MAG: hypothetical protein ACI4BC_02880 [Muribaculaceae bacterium]